MEYSYHLSSILQPSIIGTHDKITIQYSNNYIIINYDSYIFTISKLDKINTLICTFSTDTYSIQYSIDNILEQDNNITMYINDLISNENIPLSDIKKLKSKESIIVNGNKIEVYYEDTLITYLNIEEITFMDISLIMTSSGIYILYRGDPIFTPFVYLEQIYLYQKLHNNFKLFVTKNKIIVSNGKDKFIFNNSAIKIILDLPLTIIYNRKTHTVTNNMYDKNFNDKFKEYYNIFNITDFINNYIPNVKNNVFRIINSL